MRREQATLMMLATAKDGAFTPVQIQKAMFLLSEEAPEIFDSRSRYNFQPYDYGPFDSYVYSDIDLLRSKGMTTQGSGGRVRRYSATEAGVTEGEKLRLSLAPNLQQYVADVSGFVRRLSFSELVTAIYRKYPKMKEKSVFIG